MQLKQHYQERSHLSISKLIAASRCERRFYYQCCGVEPQGNRNALQYGKAIHKGIPFAINGDPNRALDEFGTEWDDEVWGDSKRNSISAAEAFHEFTQRTALYSLLKPPKDKLAPGDANEWEIPFAVDIGLDVPLFGRVDGLGEHRYSKDLWVIEYKTTSQLTENLLDATQLHPQAIGYVIALRALGLEVQGTIFDFIRTTTRGVTLQSHPVYVNDHMIETWLQWAKWVGETILSCERNDLFPCRLSGCNSYASFGLPGFQCEYTDMCRANKPEDALPLYKIVEPQQTVRLEDGRELKTFASDTL